MKDELCRVSVLDNACGSGAFLLAAMDVLLTFFGELVLEIAGPRRPAILGTCKPRTATEGASTTTWFGGSSVRTSSGWTSTRERSKIAKLRLWLALISRAPDAPEQVEPLPNVDYNLRVGNSLVGFGHWPKKGGLRLTSLEVDCTDLARSLPDDLRKRVEPGWKKGQLFDEAIRARQELIRAFVGCEDGVVAVGMKRAIDSFDGRVRGRVDDAWEFFLREQVEDDAWLKIYRSRKPELRPFHWAYEFPSMMGDGGPSVIITNPPWERVGAELREFHAQWWPGIWDEKTYKTQDLDGHLERLYNEFPEARKLWKERLEFYEFYRTYFHRVGLWKNQGRGDLNFYKLFLEHYLRICAGGMARPDRLWGHLLRSVL